MASTDLPPIMLDHLYSMDDNLKAGGPLLLLEEARENVVIGDEPPPETTPVIEPASISRCCIEKGLFPTVPLFFQYPCSINKGWSEWVDRELLDPSTCNILHRAQDIHIEGKMLYHVVRRWSTATHTFVCSWGEFTPTLEDVANISRLSVCGDRSPFDIALTPEEVDKLAVLWRGAPTSPSTSLRFSNWIQYFDDANRQGPCRLDAFIAMWLRRFVLCDFSQDCLHERVFPLSLVIAPGDTIPLAPIVGCTFTPSLACYEASRLGQGFLYAKKSSLKTFTFVPFYADVSDTVEGPAAMSQGGQFKKYALLNVTPIPLPTLGDSRSEISVPYLPHRVRRQFGLDQGVPSSPNHADPFALHRVFWSNDPIPNSCRPIVLASKRRIGGFSQGYQAYWNRYLASFCEFQSFLGDRLPPTTARLAGLVSEEKVIPLSQKRNLPFISKSGDIVGEFPKTKPKPGVQSPRGSGKDATPVSSKRKREEEQGVRMKQTAGKPKKFIPKVASSGPPRTKEATPPERP
ncbi:unnamed protein product, partial [Prunus brigantina]